MTDILSLQERVQNTIRLGESHFREFKTASEGKPENKKPRLVTHICRDIGEALVAFSNADGGELLIGVEDDGQITGIPHNNDDITIMLNAPNTHIFKSQQLPLIFSTQVIIDGKIILFFQVEKGISTIYQLPDGRCVRRKDKATMPADFREIQLERQEQRSREYDRQFVDGATVSDLDITLIQQLANEYFMGLSAERYLQQAGLAEYAVNGLRLRRATVLLFAKDIGRWNPHSHVRILRVNGTELKTGERYNVLSDEFVQGNIFKLIEDAWSRLRVYLTSKTEFGADAKFEQKFLYPEGACFEALINAIAHRDYSTHNGIEIYIYDDRMEVRNPGALLSTITIQDLKELRGAHESRNVLIAKILRENKYMRELGEGVRRMFDLMNDEMTVPEFHSNGSSFWVILPNKPLLSSKQQAWLDMFAEYNLSANQKRIVLLGMNGREISQDDIYQAMQTEELRVYNEEVTSLRKKAILVEIRNQIAAKNYAHKRNIKPSKIPRFRVQIPNGDNNVLQQSRKLTRNRKCGIHLENLPADITRKALEDSFSEYGDVNYIYLARDENTKKLKGFGTIWFNTEQSAKKAFDALKNNAPFNIKLVYPYRPPNSKPK
ncbi:MAG: ATP-binding protein [bacterium]|nr:ATP-binding protein [bacterium]